MSKTYKDYPVLPNGRINFSKISGSLELPNLVEIQTDSYKWFLEKGMQEVMEEVFPIASYTETSFIDYVSCETLSIYSVASTHSPQFSKNSLICFT